DVEQEISQATNATASTLTPTVSQRKVKSSVSVANGQTVLLAGLIQEKNELDRGGIPLLDQIPKVGDLFAHQTKNVVRTELIIFIRPQVIRDAVDASFVAEEFRTKLRGTIESPPPPVSRTAPRHIRARPADAHHPIPRRGRLGARGGTDPVRVEAGVGPRQDEPAPLHDKGSEQTTPREPLHPGTHPASPFLRPAPRQGVQ